MCVIDVVRRSSWAYNTMNLGHGGGHVLEEHIGGPLSAGGVVPRRPVGKSHACALGLQVNSVMI